MDQTPAPDAAAECDRLAALAALAGPVTHEFNNFLNAVVLQVAVLQQQAGGAVRDDLAALRRQGKRMADLVHRWQNYRQRSQPPPRPVDLNQLVRDEVDALCGRGRVEGPGGEAVLALEGADMPPGAVVVRLAFAADLPPVPAAPADLRVLVRFLVTNAAAALAAPQGARGGSVVPIPLVTVRTGADAEGVTLAVADTGPAVPPERLAQVFDPFEEVRDGPNPLELFACESLVRRRLRGRLEAKPGPDGGVELLARLPV